MIYLDYNSTAPYSNSVVDYLKGEMANDWGNASSDHEIGYRLSGKIKEDRQVIADFLDCSTGKLFFTSGGTESINTVLSERNIKNLKVESVITSRLEHHATLDCCKFLSEKTKILNVDHDRFGNIHLDHLEKTCKENPSSLISLSYVNNETGVIAPAKEIIRIGRKYHCLIHFDSVQALGKEKFSLDDLDADFASFSGHKVGSLKGVGLLYVSDLQRFCPYMKGGGQERGHRAGTYNYAGIHSLRLAIEDIDFNKSPGDLRNFFEEKFLEMDSSFQINAMDAPRVANTSNIYLGEINSSQVMLQLSSKGISVATGSACQSGNTRPSHVISEMVSEDHAASSLRISLGPSTSEHEIKQLLMAFEEMLKSL